MIPGCCPPGTVGAGVAVTGGLNTLPPVGLRFFSVGDAGAGVVVVVVVVVVVLDGAWVVLPPHAAVRAPTAMIAAPPTTAPRPRPKPRESIIAS